MYGKPYLSGVMLCALAALVGLGMITITSSVLQYPYPSSHTVDTENASHSLSSWMVLSELLPREKTGPDTKARHIVRAHFESQMKEAHAVANGESLFSYCARDNFNSDFTAAAKKRYLHMLPNQARDTGSQRIFIAVNLFNSERILPNMATQLLAFAEIIGHKNVFLSIFENGSTDNTKHIIDAFDKTLNELGIPHNTVADNKPRPQTYHRIEYMADLRNRALEPLYRNATIYSRVVFLNDVFFCLPDLFELVHQSLAYQAHLTCAEDFETRHGILEFYDTWVSRDLLGRAFKSRYQNIADDGAALIGQLHNRPFQVQCCWNGAAVLDASVFRGSNALNFRRSFPGECSASECSLLCNDLWQAGYQRALVVPRVKVTYNIETRDLLRRPSNFPRDVPFHDQDPAKMVFKPGPATVYCNPLNGMDVSVPDGPASFIDLHTSRA
ncbi:hypothetical protein H4R24_002506 [Coemansia sp. RSA 988]|nr:hypothetical protein H4R24_002506 [Coemansia sp. RSA 988]